MRRRIRGTLAFLLAGTAATQELVLRPVAPGAGPLLVFAWRDRPDDTSAPMHWSLHDLERGETAEFATGKGILRLLCRLDPRHLLATWTGDGEGLLVLDLRNGARRTIAGLEATFVGVRGGDVLFLGDPGEQDERLHVRAWTRDAGPRLLASPRLQAVTLIGDAVYAAAVDGSTVLRIDAVTGEVRTLGDMPPGARPEQTRFARSPRGERLAVGFACGGAGVLRVLDLATGKVLREWAGMPIRLPPFSKYMTELDVAWRDDDEVLAVETRFTEAAGSWFVAVGRSVASGRELRTEHRGSSMVPPVPVPVAPPVMTLTGTWPPGTEPQVVGAFTCCGEVLSYRGREEEVARCATRQFGGRIELTPDGRHAVVPTAGDKPGLDVVDGEQRTRRRVHDGWTFDWVWLAPLR